jgi:hypothetical protein
MYGRLWLEPAFRLSVNKLAAREAGSEELPASL